MNKEARKLPMRGGCFLFPLYRVGKRSLSWQRKENRELRAEMEDLSQMSSLKLKVLSICLKESHAMISEQAKRNRRP